MVVEAIVHVFLEPGMWSGYVCCLGEADSGERSGEPELTRVHAAIVRMSRKCSRRLAGIFLGDMGTLMINSPRQKTPPRAVVYQAISL